MWVCRVTRHEQGNNKLECYFMKEANGGSMFGGCTCGQPYTNEIHCHHMVAVVKSSRLDGLTATNSMPVWWTTECWRNQYPEVTNETCHWEMDTLRETPEDAAMRYCPPYAAPRKAGRPKTNKCMKSLLEGQKQRKSTRGKSEAIMDDNEGEENKEEPCYPKRARSWRES